MYDELIAELRQHHCDAKEDDTQEVCEECSYDVIIVDKSAPSGFASVCVCGLMNRAADAIEKLSKPRWIPVTERLPELRQNVLVSDGKGSGEGWLDRYDWHDPNREDVVYTSPQPRDFWCIPGCKVDEDHVTHWMPLPSTEGLSET